MFLIMAAALIIRGGCVCMFCAQPDTESGTQAGDRLSAALPEEYTKSMDRLFAREFSVDYYGEDYTLIVIHSQFRYLLVEEGAEIPEDLPEDVTILQKPFSHIYAASSSCPDFFRELHALDRVTMTSTKAEDWTIPALREASEREDMIFVGKYSAPDYEYICDEGCDLAIENTMIYHAPEVSEMLTRLGIPVLTEYSSYEEEPLGRLEWIRLYGLLTDRQEEADAFFEEQIARINRVLEEEGAQTSGADVVFFYISSNGTVNVRRENDYVSRMIAMAGGRYLLHDLVESLPASDSQSGSVALSMESFYDAAKDADILIYNGTLGESPESVEDLIRRCPLLADFKAVKNKNVYCSRDSLFQEVTGTARMIEDFSHVISQAGRESAGADERKSEEDNPENERKTGEDNPESKRKSEEDIPESEQKGGENDEELTFLRKLR